jgi:hypothetical protein
MREDSYWNNGGWPFLPIVGYLPDDLKTIYDDAETMLTAIRLVGEAACAMDLLADNFDNHPDPLALARGSIHRLELQADAVLREKGNDFFRASHFSKLRWNGKEVMAPSLAEAVSAIAEVYRARLGGSTP